MKLYKDNYNHYATIEKIKIYPHQDANKKETAYILKCYSIHNNDLMYFCSVYQTQKEATEKLQEFSCGTFKESGRKTRAWNTSL